MRHVLISILIFLKDSFEIDINDTNLSCGPLNLTKFRDEALSVSYSYDRLTRTTKASFSCNNGTTLYYLPISYKFVSTNCINGTWYRTLDPNCYQSCQIPPIEYKHGRILNITDDYLQKLLYLCDDGYMTVDNQYNDMCTGGKWMNRKKNFTCVPIPGNLTLPSCPPLAKKDRKFAEITYSGFNHGSLATFKCAKGYHVKGKTSEAYCLGGRFRTAGSTPSCVQDKCSMPDLTNDLVAFFPNDRMDFPTLVLFTCFDGFELSGNFWSICKRGNWRPKITASCNFTSRSYSGCRRVRSIKFYGNLKSVLANPIITYSSDNLKHLTIATFFCPEEYYLMGPRFRMCIDGIWKPFNISFCSIYPLGPIDEDVQPYIGVYAIQTVI